MCIRDSPKSVATKEANDNISALAETRALCGEELAVYSGNDNQIAVSYTHLAQ